MSENDKSDAKNAASPTYIPALTKEDKDRIYAEEKERDRARARIQSEKAGKRLLGCLGLIVVIVVFIQLGSSKSKNAEEPPAPPAIPIAHAQSPAPIPAPPSPPTPSPSPTPEPKWRNVATWQGSAQVNTPPFTIVGQRWRIRYNSKLNGRTSGTFSIELHRLPDGPAKLLINGPPPGPAETNVYEGPGTYYLEIDSLFLNWGVAVDELN